MATRTLSGVVRKLLPPQGGWQSLQIETDGSLVEIQVCAYYASYRTECPLTDAGVRKVGAKITASGVPFEGDPSKLWKVEQVKFLSTRPMLNVDTSEISFNQVALGKEVIQKFHIVNNGEGDAAEVVVIAPQLEGLYVDKKSCGPMGANATCEVGVHYRPVKPSPFTASILINGFDSYRVPLPTLKVSLIGNGVEPPNVIPEANFEFATRVGPNWNDPATPVILQAGARLTLKNSASGIRDLIYLPCKEAAAIKIHPGQSFSCTVAPRYQRNYFYDVAAGAKGYILLK